jgi:hypothetical protein
MLLFIKIFMYVVLSVFYVIQALLFSVVSFLEPGWITGWMTEASWFSSKQSKRFLLQGIHAGFEMYPAFSPVCTGGSRPER